MQDIWYETHKGFVTHRLRTTVLVGFTIKDKFRLWNNTCNLFKGYCIPLAYLVLAPTPLPSRIAVFHSHGLSNSCGLVKHGDVYLQSLHSQESDQDHEAEVSSVYVARPVSKWINEWMSIHTLICAVSLAWDAWELLKRKAHATITHLTLSTLSLPLFCLSICLFFIPLTP